MKPITEIYPNLKKEENSPYLEGLGGYQPMLDSFGEIVLQVDDEDYSGDSRVIYKNKKGQYGLLVFGWGSCSGCDALEACDTIEEVDTLRNELHNQIIWKDSARELLEFIMHRDWTVQWSYYHKETKEFVVKAIDLLWSISNESYS